MRSAARHVGWDAHARAVQAPDRADASDRVRRRRMRCDEQDQGARGSSHAGSSHRMRWWPGSDARHVAGECGGRAAAPSHAHVLHRAQRRWCGYAARVYHAPTGRRRCDCLPPSVFLDQRPTRRAPAGHGNADAGCCSCHDPRQPRLRVYALEVWSAGPVWSGIGPAAESLTVRPDRTMASTNV
jgi:hypothetical protein